MKLVHDPAELDLQPGQVLCSAFQPDPDGDYMLAPSTGGEPEPCRAVYFAAPADADEWTMRELAFEAREGRPMEPYQRWTIHEAMRTDA